MKKSYKITMSTKMLANDTAEVRIYGEMASSKWWGDEITPKEFAEELDKVKDAKTLNVYIDTPGGDVFAGFAMRSELVKHKASEKNVYITGLCASAGTLPMCMPKEVNVQMYKGSMMMIHYPSTWAYGTASEITKRVQTLESITESVLDIYKTRTGLDIQTLKDYMEAESYFTAEQAVELGFANAVVEEEAQAVGMHADVAQMLGYKHVPKELLYTDDDGVNITNNAETKTNGGVKTMTLEELRAQEPQLCEQLIAEGVKNENARLQALDEVYAPDSGDLVMQAKYGEQRMTAADLCVQLNKAQKEKMAADKANAAAMGTAHIENRAKETEVIQNVGQSNDEKTEDNQGIEMLIGALNKKGGK